MQVTYELTQKDFFDSLIAHRNRSAIGKWTARVLVSIVLVVFGAGLLVLAMRPNAQALSNFVPLFALAAVWIVLLWAYPWWTARKQFSNQPSAHGQKTMLVDPVGVHWRWNGGSADVEWKNYIRILEVRISSFSIHRPLPSIYYRSALSLRNNCLSSARFLRRIFRAADELTGKEGAPAPARYVGVARTDLDLPNRQNTPSPLPDRCPEAE
jgi:heme/copper-type cytochrome/quinol oxidase subunit 2